MRRRSVLASTIGLAAAAGLGISGASAQTRPLKIGVLTDMGGPFSSMTGPGVVEAARMAVEDFGGEVAGRKIEILVADHQNKADVGTAIVRQWFDVDGVDAVADIVGSAIALATSEIAKEKKKILLYSGAGSSDLTGRACMPYGFHWTWDSYALAVGTATAIVGSGKKSWFFLTQDYAMGHATERDATQRLAKLGGSVVGSAAAPLNTVDYSSFILQAQASRAEVLALATTAGTVPALKQAHEFGLDRSGMLIAPLQLTLTETHAVGLEVAQGVRTVAAFYWGQSPDSVAWSRKFYARRGAMPSDMQAGVYSAVRHYLQAIKDTGSVDPDVVANKMRATKINDMFAKDGWIRKDGRVIHDMYLVEAKKPSESTEPWDYFRVLSKLSGEDVFRPLAEGGCSLVQ